MSHLIAITFTVMLALLSSFSLAEEAAQFQPGVPDGLEIPIIERMVLDADGNWVDTLAEPLSSLRATNSYNWQGWLDNANGPGQLHEQYALGWSGILSGSSSTSGYIDYIDYEWSGYFNGWRNIRIAAVFYDNNGQYIRAYGVGSQYGGQPPKTGRLVFPHHVMKANTKIRFAFWVHRAPRLAISNGPVFNNVSVKVHTN